MSKILITGAEGFIGRALVSKLEAKGWQVIPVSYKDGDIASKETLNKFLSNDIGYVFHLAGRTYVPHSWSDPITFYQTNVLGTLNVLEFCRAQTIPMTYVSAYVYGHPCILPIAENDAIVPSNPYALTKRLAEETCEFYARMHKLLITIVRPFNVYGIGQNVNFLIPTILNQTFDLGNEIVVTDLSPKRDYIYLEDLIAALMQTLVDPTGYRVYNIGSGSSLSVQAVIDIIQQAAGTKKNVISRNLIRPEEIIDVIADISRAKIDLGWHPKYSFQDGIAEIISSGKY